MSTKTNPIQIWDNCRDLVELSFEANTVIGLRMMGLAGLWPVAPSEISRMITEKQFAFARSATAAGMSAISGNLPDQVLKAAIAPVRASTTANVKRLSNF